ncbi:ATP-binding cassette domain-containing protein [Oceanobacter sp. 5_MG-2023]|uniref:ABC transporter ATP-binding protein n=1 Tax=Oceanobacter sp. 5_MG-2023 TaxID=3062645 RepID=UPI0026E43DFC|nr:ATP-binding cassette domain-containing protein [Oceanobacter sp. 5_MG-2023]MDO6680704.1 ATP-binding cassette domain-containing protein [Oceanobacter sp. 5_MG-2023]
MSAVALEKISSQILHEVSLNVADGEAVAIQGPSGSGKSTLLKVVAGLVAHQGRVLFDDTAVHGWAPHRRRLGYLSQDLHLFPHLTVRQNVWLSLAFGFDHQGSRAERIEEALCLARAQHLHNRYPAQLSGGERQRAALARCLARRPGVLLLDEPFSSLDLGNRHTIWRDLNALRQPSQMTLLLVTHDETEAQVLADRTVWLQHGQIVSR